VRFAHCYSTGWEKEVGRRFEPFTAREVKPLRGEGRFWSGREGEKVVGVLGQLLLPEVMT